MDNQIIKHMLENKISRVYSLIVQLYFDKIELYKASVFKAWLSKELEIAPEMINERSITAALSRYKKRKKTESKISTAQSTMMKEEKQKSEIKDEDFNTEIPKVFPGFR
jgi:hypothetical protein